MEPKTKGIILALTSDHRNSNMGYGTSQGGDGINLQCVGGILKTCSDWTSGDKDNMFGSKTLEQESRRQLENQSR